MPLSGPKRAAWSLVVFAIAAAVSGIGCGESGQASSQLVASVRVMSGAGVASVDVSVLRATDPCGSSSKVSSGSISVGAAANDAGDALVGRVTFVVAPGTYRLCAKPLDANGRASDLVSPAETTATLGPGATVEITLSLRVTGDGGMDAPVQDAGSDGGEDAGEDQRVDAGEDQRVDAGNEASDARDAAGPELSVLPDTCNLHSPAPYGIIGDFDGDGVKDCVGTAGQNSLLNFHKGLASGGYDEAPVVSAMPCLPKPGDERLQAVVDLDGDHREDIVLSNTSTTVPYEGPTAFHLLNGHANGTFECSLQPAQVSGVPVGIEHAIADFNGDGRQDVFYLVTTGVDKAVHWIALTGSAGSTAPAVRDTPAGFLLGPKGFVASYVSGNLDADAYKDVTVKLMIQGITDPIYVVQTLVIHGNGDATFKCGAGSMTVACPNQTPYPTIRSCQASGAFGGDCVRKQ